MSKLIAWVKPRWKAAVAWVKPRWKAAANFITVAVAGAIAQGLIVGQAAAWATVVIGVIGTIVVHQVTNTPTPVAPEVAPPPGG